MTTIRGGSSSGGSSGIAVPPPCDPDPAGSADAGSVSAAAAIADAVTTAVALKDSLSSHSVPAYGGEEQQQEEDDNDNKTYMARLILRLDFNLRKLGVFGKTTTRAAAGNKDDDDDDDDEEEIVMMRRMEGMAVLIHESMSISSRNYHSVQHVFDISDAMTDPVPILAALFHDTIYYHVDGGFSQRQLECLDGAVLEPTKCGESGCRLLSSQQMADDPLLAMVASVFGFEGGQQLTPMGGVNEFLSAVIAVRELEGLLPLSILVQIAGCIEATIPFRPSDPQTGETPMDRLYLRMVLTNAAFQLGMSDDDLVLAVQRAVVLGNADVGNFAAEDEAWFLDNTWSLLPETNSALRHRFLYTVQDFQLAVYRMHGFFAHFLKPSLIFQEFRGVPTPSELAQLTDRAARNIEIGRKYVAAKLLSVSVLSAFADLTGGDAPISLFMGDLPSRDRGSAERRIDSLLPRYDADALRDDCDRVVYLLLSEGRKTETAFDVKQSPLAAYLYAYMGDTGLDSILKDVPTYPMNESTARNLLSRLPRPSVEVVADCIAKVAKSRSERIHQVVDSLPPAKIPDEEPSIRRQEDAVPS